MAMPSLTRPATLALAALVVLTGVHLGSIVVAPETLLNDVTQALLMPVVAIVLLAAVPSPRSRLVLLVLVALAMSWLGDAAPLLVDGDLTALLVKVGFFLLAQVAFIAAFWPWRHRTVVARSPWAFLPYAAALVAILALVRDGIGGLEVPVVVYAVTITVMAVLATGLGPLAGVGGAVFLLSDAILAVGTFSDRDLPANGVWVMLTYVVGEALIVLGVTAHEQQANAQPRVTPVGG